MLQMEFVTELFILDMKEMDPSRAGFGTGSCETVDYHAGHDECDSGKAGDTGQSVRRKGDRVKTVQGNRSPARIQLMGSMNKYRRPALHIQYPP